MVNRETFFFVSLSNRDWNKEAEKTLMERGNSQKMCHFHPMKYPNSYFWLPSFLYGSFWKEEKATSLADFNYSMPGSAENERGKEDHTQKFFHLQSLLNPQSREHILDPFSIILPCDVQQMPYKIAMAKAPHLQAREQWLSQQLLTQRKSHHHGLHLLVT